MLGTGTVSNEDLLAHVVSCKLKAVVRHDVLNCVSTSDGRNNGGKLRVFCLSGADCGMSRE
jgi:hypothetical protein